ncbi:MAG: ABC transporter ATP-binding protein [Clostridiales bacterium]|jgi:putative ABC transport system ATP-binding protein|nr:ABC transporter ATP-binding protein [Clostridiales bacterium]MBQ2606298.1 ABC transporter ATP-binding protein [Clostridiales bacterium]MBQ4190811.1 ABC transporter ATP-binding protein [Clostridiales bacterium]MBQ5422587.1 ABC transporter ATP-binding protein [Clostridiales bacterium]MBQ7627941.1 ABC transporter ATP-binding protein [Clostridiales bacterium]
MSYIEFRNVSKTYKTGSVEVHALDNCEFFIEKGELCVIVGQSGAGKTTLLNILGGMDHLTTGQVFLDGREISALQTRELAKFRRENVGFVFQFYNLISNLTAYENVEMAAQLVKDPIDCDLLMNEVGLADRRNNFPAQLSGGEQQRVAIARAIAKNPKLLLCDEPTGALDYQTGKQILHMLQHLSTDKKMTVVIITHNSALTAMADRVIRVKNGKVISNVINTNPVNVDDIEW